MRRWGLRTAFSPVSEASQPQRRVGPRVPPAAFVATPAGAAGGRARLRDLTAQASAWGLGAEVGTRLDGLAPRAQGLIPLLDKRAGVAIVLAP